MYKIEWTIPENNFLFSGIFRKITSYFPEIFRKITSYFPEVFRKISTYFLEVCRKITSYFPEIFRKIASFYYYCQKMYLLENYIFYRQTDNLIHSNSAPELKKIYTRNGFKDIVTITPDAWHFPSVATLFGFGPPPNQTLGNIINKTSWGWVWPSSAT